MGLDMELNMRIYLPFGIEIPSLNNIKPNYNFEYVSTFLCAWRNENYLHYWFVRTLIGEEKYNRCDGGDLLNGHSFQLELYELRGLLNDCKKVALDNSLAQEILPTMQGHFFGETNYDEFYFDSVQLRIEELDELIDRIEKIQDDLDDNYSIELYYSFNY